MTKEVKQLIIVGVLVVFLIFALMNNFKKKPSKKTAPANKPSSEAAASLKAASSAEDTPTDSKILTLQKQRLDLEWGRDPFNMAIDKEFQFADLKLKGISFGENKQGYAFVNDEIVRKGDQVGNYEVVEVEKNRILLRKAGQNFYLAFPQE